MKALGNIAMWKQLISLGLLAITVNSTRNTARPSNLKFFEDLKPDQKFPIHEIESLSNITGAVTMRRMPKGGFFRRVRKFWNDLTKDYAHHYCYINDKWFVYGDPDIPATNGKRNVLIKGKIKLADIAIEPKTITVRGQSNEGFDVKEVRGEKRNWNFLKPPFNFLIRDRAWFDSNLTEVRVQNILPLPLKYSQDPPTPQSIATKPSASPASTSNNPLGPPPARVVPPPIVIPKVQTATVSPLGQSPSKKSVEPASGITGTQAHNPMDNPERETTRVLQNDKQLPPSESPSISQNQPKSDLAAGLIPPPTIAQRLSESSRPGSPSERDGREITDGGNYLPKPKRKTEANGDKSDSDRGQASEPTRDDSSSTTGTKTIGKLGKREPKKAETKATKAQKTVRASVVPFVMRNDSGKIVSVGFRSKNFEKAEGGNRFERTFTYELDEERYAIVLKPIKVEKKIGSIMGTTSSENGNKKIIKGMKHQLKYAPNWYLVLADMLNVDKELLKSCKRLSKKVREAEKFSQDNLDFCKTRYEKNEDGKLKSLSHFSKIDQFDPSKNGEEDRFYIRLK